MFTLYKRGTIYWMRRCEEGKEIRLSLSTRSLKTARQLVELHELDRLSGGKLRRIRWPEFQTEFLAAMELQVRPSTIRGYKYILERFTRFLDDQSLSQLRDITPGVIVGFCAERRNDQHPDWKRPKTDSGMKFDLRILHLVFGYAVRCGYVDKNPVITRNLNSKPRGTLPFSPQEIAKMLAETNRHPLLHAIITTFLYTGLRIGDVMSLKKKDINGDVLRVNTRKRDTIVTLHVHADLRVAIDAHLKAQSAIQRKSELMFSTQNGRPIVSLARDLRRVWKKCGISGAHAHRFRDTLAVRLLSQGASLYDVAKLLGNSAAVVEKYYAPYVRELVERGSRLISEVSFAAAQSEIVPPETFAQPALKSAWTN